MRKRATTAAETRLITAADVAQMVDIVGRDGFMDAMISSLRTCFESHRPEGVDARPRDGFRYQKPDLGLIEWMPSHQIGGPVVVKMVGYHPSNPKRHNLPSVLATSYLWDTETGHLAAIADATFLTAVRTGAASAIAADFLAIDAPLQVSIVGLGAQAVTQLHALSRVRPIARVLGCDVSDEAAASFARRVEFVDAAVEIVPMEERPSLLEEADVLVTCTSVDIGAGPVVPDGPSRPWLHTNAVGADFPGKIELPRRLVDRSLVVPDSLVQCQAEGECQVLDAESIGPELFEIVQSGADSHRHRSGTTVFDSTGWSIEDDVALRLALELAEAHDLGRTIAIESVPVDPLDPYAFPSALVLEGEKRGLG